jgi:hypothetical protein
MTNQFNCDLSQGLSDQELASTAGGCSAEAFERMWNERAAAIRVLAAVTGRDPSETALNATYSGWRCSKYE